ncbi:MAG: hypothetical protein L0H19_08400, partial [Salinisphaera sp.]|nr:hypothetical protein [Salinisphaera sp.]
PTFEMDGEDPSAAATGSREAWWPEAGESRESALYSFEKLRPGNRITGPAIVEAEFTTIVIPPGEQFAINEHGLGVMQADDPGTPHTTVVGAVVYE